MLRNGEEANDIVQEAYMKLWQNVDKIEFTKAKSWLFTTARNTMLNQIKRNNKMESMSLRNFKEPYSNESDAELKEIIDKSLDQLPEIQKAIILLKDLEGYNYKEIGEILGLNESQVKVYLFRGRKKIKETLKYTFTYHESN